MKLIFTFLFLSTLGFSQKCYQDEKGKENHLILSDDNLFYIGHFANSGGFFGKARHDLIEKVYFTEQEKLYFKIEEENQVNLLGEYFIRKSKLFKKDCSELEIQLFQNAKKWHLNE